MSSRWDNNRSGFNVTSCLFHMIFAYNALQDARALVTDEVVAAYMKERELKF